jgi:hypothetical protein
MSQTPETLDPPTAAAPPPIPFLIAQRGAWLALLAIWVLMAGISLRASLADIERQSEEVAIEGAREMFRMILLTRTWNAEHNGVYVAVTEQTQPSPTLTSRTRDAT